MFDSRKYTVHSLHTAVKYEIDRTDSLDSVGFEPEEYDYWINSAIREVVKGKFSGSGVRGEAFEQSQKRIDDLRSLIRSTRLSVTKGTDDYDRSSVYKASLPSSTANAYWFSISEEVDIVYPVTSPSDVANGNLVVGTWYKVVQTSGASTEYVTQNGTNYYDGAYFEAAATTTYTESGGTFYIYECTKLRQGITEVTASTYTFQVNSPYSEHILHNGKAKPLRLFEEDEVQLTTDGTYGIAYFYLKYLKIPQYISVTKLTQGNNEIEEGVYYDVSSNTVTYNSVTYDPGDVFIGVSGQTDFTGTGEVRKTADLTDEVLDEVIKEAANMMLENTQNPRYQTHTIETKLSE